MTSKAKLILGSALLALVVSVPAMAESTKAYTQKSSTVGPDGSVSYQSHTVVTKGNVTRPAPEAVVAATGQPLVTFYYWNPELKRIVSASDLNNDIIALWDADKNRVIDNHEFYTNALVAYEPIEYSRRTFQDIDADGMPELTQQEYTLRLQQIPGYSAMDRDGKEGLTIREFTGVGFQDADHNNNNQVSFDELRRAFYTQEGLMPKQLKLNN